MYLATGRWFVSHALDLRYSRGEAFRYTEDWKLITTLYLMEQVFSVGALHAKIRGLASGVRILVGAPNCQIRSPVS